jgi:hypothetical protein
VIEVVHFRLRGHRHPGVGEIGRRIGQAE